MKYIVSWCGGFWLVNPDKQDYDGPVTNLRDPEDYYHVEASSIDEAIELAAFEKAVDEGC